MDNSGQRLPRLQAKTGIQDDFSHATTALVPASGRGNFGRGLNRFRNNWLIWPAKQASPACLVFRSKTNLMKISNETKVGVLTVVAPTVLIIGFNF